MRKIGLIANPRHPESHKYTSGLSDWLLQRHYEVYSQSLSGQDGDTFADKPDMVLAMGGDGTLLSAARITAPLGIPILGVNLGNLGFLTEVEAEHLYPSLEQVLEGRYVEDHRMMLQAEVLRSGEIVSTICGLNDVVVHKGSISRLLEINFWVEKDFAASCKGDGIIIASPTGSTAYSLSAGGPVVHPSLEVMVQTWISPHTITVRPTVIPPDKYCMIELVNISSEVLLTVDGQTSLTLQEKDRIIIKKAPYKATFIRLSPLKFFSLLKTKLGSETIAHDV